METAQTKICSKCGEKLKIENFSFQKKKENKRHPECKKCATKQNQKYKEYRKKYRELNKEKLRAQNKEYQKRVIVDQKVQKEKQKLQLRRNKKRQSYEKNKERQKTFWYKKKYGISIEDVEKIVLHQNKKCPICSNRLPERYHVDHNHKIECLRDSVRGILCYVCNGFLLVGYEKIRHLISPNQRWPLLEEYLNNPPAQRVLTEYINCNISKA